MFLGQFQHNLDDKGRLMIPARYRELLAAGAYITQGFDRCLMVMTDDHFRQVYERINSMNPADATTRHLRRLILSNAYQVEVDKVGRILVPQNLREFLGVESGELIVAGGEPHFDSSVLVVHAAGELDTVRRGDSPTHVRLVGVLPAQIGT